MIANIDIRLLYHPIETFSFWGYNADPVTSFGMTVVISRSKFEEGFSHIFQYLLRSKYVFKKSKITTTARRLI